MFVLSRVHRTTFAHSLFYLTFPCAVTLYIWLRKKRINSGTKCKNKNAMCFMLNTRELQKQPLSPQDHKTSRAVSAKSCQLLKRNAFGNVLIIPQLSIAPLYFSLFPPLVAYAAVNKQKKTKMHWFSFVLFFSRQDTQGEGQSNDLFNNQTQVSHVIGVRFTKWGTRALPLLEIFNIYYQFCKLLELFLGEYNCGLFLN